MNCIRSAMTMTSGCSLAVVPGDVPRYFLLTTIRAMRIRMMMGDMLDNVGTRTLLLTTNRQIDRKTDRQIVRGGTATGVCIIQF